MLPRRLLDEARCAEISGDLWYDPHVARQMKGVCARCPVQYDCLLHTLRIEADEPARVEGYVSEVYGIAGGLNPGERRALLKRILLRGESVESVVDDVYLDWSPLKPRRRRAWKAR